MEKDNIECKGGPICDQVVLGVEEIARRVGAMDEQGCIRWAEMSKDVKADELRVAIEEAKRKTNVPTVAFRAFEEAWKLIENDTELTVSFALKMWGMALINESEQDRNQRHKKEIEHAAMCVSTILTRISISSPSPWGETSGAEGELHR